MGIEKMNRFARKVAEAAEGRAHAEKAALNLALERNAVLLALMAREAPSSELVVPVEEVKRAFQLASRLRKEIVTRPVVRSRFRQAVARLLRLPLPPPVEVIRFYLPGPEEEAGTPEAEALAEQGD